MNLNADSYTASLLDYWKHLSSLPEPVRELMLSNWDETGRPLNDAPVRQFLIGLCEQCATDNSSFDAFKKLAYGALQGATTKHLSEAMLEDYYLMFMGGAIYATKNLGELLKRDALNLASSDNP